MIHPKQADLEWNILPEDVSDLSEITFYLKMAMDQPIKIYLDNKLSDSFLTEFSKLTAFCNVYYFDVFLNQLPDRERPGLFLRYEEIAMFSVRFLKKPASDESIDK